nr:unnamed protein product [Callosobruchus chinensis]
MEGMIKKVRDPLPQMENTCLEEFIAIYHNEPCLWRVKSKDYHDRVKNEAAYLKLIKKWKEIDPSLLFSKKLII